MPKTPFSEMSDPSLVDMDKQNFTNNMYQNIVNSKVNNFTMS